MNPLIIIGDSLTVPFIKNKVRWNRRGKMSQSKGGSKPLGQKGGRNGGIRENPLKLAFIIILILAFVNPWVENIMTYEPYIFMTSHYSLIFSGILAGNWFFRGNKVFAVIGIIPIVFWHLPLFWQISSLIYPYRLLSEATLWLGGFFIGSSLKFLNTIYKIILLSLWMIGDTALSVLFLIGNSNYLTVYYTIDKLQITGAVMFILMNIFLIYILAIWFKKYFQI